MFFATGGLVVTQKDPCRETDVKVVDKLFGCVNIVVLGSVLVKIFG
jgi:hypothetical protein